MITFKNFLKENDDPYERAIKEATVNDPSLYPDFNWDNADGKYNYKGVIFDAKHGLGATPNNQDLKYNGFIIMISPNEFLKLAIKADDEDLNERSSKLFDLIHNGKVSLGPPMFYIQEDEDKLRVQSHEGRGRMKAIGKIIGMNTKVPVAINVRRGNKGPWSRWPEENKIKYLSLIKNSLMSESSNDIPVIIDTVLYK